MASKIAAIVVALVYLGWGLSIVALVVHLLGQVVA